MSDLCDQHNENLIPDLVDDPVVSHSHTVEVLALNPLTSVRTRVLGQMIDGWPQTLLNIGWELPELASSPRGELDSVSGVHKPSSTLRVSHGVVPFSLASLIAVRESRMSS